MNGPQPDFDSVKVKEENIESAEIGLLRSWKDKERSELQQNTEETTAGNDQSTHDLDPENSQRHNSSAESPPPNAAATHIATELSREQSADKQPPKDPMNLALEEYPADDDDEAWIKLFPKKTEADYAGQFADYIRNTDVNAGYAESIESTKKKIKQIEEEISRVRAFGNGGSNFEAADDFFGAVEELVRVDRHDRRNMIRKNNLLLHSNFAILPLRLLTFTADSEILEKDGKPVNIRNLHFEKSQEKHSAEIKELETQLEFSKQRLEEAESKRGDIQRRANIYIATAKEKDAEILEINLHNKRLEVKVKRELLKKMEEDRKEAQLRESLLDRGASTRPIEVGEQTIYAKEPVFKIKEEEQVEPSEKLMKSFNDGTKEGRRFHREWRLKKRIDHAKRRAAGEEGVSEDDAWDEKLDGAFSDDSDNPDELSDDNDGDDESNGEQKQSPVEQSEQAGLRDSASERSDSGEQREKRPQGPSKFVLSWAGKPIAKSTGYSPTTSTPEPASSTLANANSSSISTPAGPKTSNTAETQNSHSSLDIPSKSTTQQKSQPSNPQSSSKPIPKAPISKQNVPIQTSINYSRRIIDKPVNVTQRRGSSYVPTSGTSQKRLASSREPVVDPRPGKKSR